MIEKRPPNTIYLGGGGPGGEGGATFVNDIVAGVAGIIPGMLIETFNEGGATKWRPHSSATIVGSVAVALEDLMMGKGVDDAYGDGDLIPAAILRHGSTFWGLLPSGQDIDNQDYLQSNGDGYLKEATANTADAGVARFKAHDQLGAITVATRCRVEVLF